MLAHRNLSLLSVALMGVALCGTTAAAAEFESPTALNAKDVLPAELISSATHRVAPSVANDGFMNRFDVSSQFGALTASSNAELAKRVHELAVVAKLEQVSKSEEFAKHLQKGAERVIKGAEKLITNPVDTVTGALSGVGKLFENASESVFGVGSGDAGKMESLIGFSAKKREYASHFGVDVYSRNEILQQHLEDVAWAGYAGGITTTAASMAVTGGAGIALSVTAGAETLNRIDMTRAPVELRKHNHDRMVAMGASADVAQLFLDNDAFTLTQQTLFVDALESVNVDGRVDIIKTAVGSANANVADFRRRQAQMYAAINERFGPITKFVTRGQLTVAVDGNGGTHIALPADHLLWTSALMSVTNQATLDGASSQTIWVSGDATETAVTELGNRKWLAKAGADSMLFGK